MYNFGLEDDQNSFWCQIILHPNTWHSYSQYCLLIEMAELINLLSLGVLSMKVLLFQLLLLDSIFIILIHLIKITTMSKKDKHKNSLKQSPLEQIHLSRTAKSITLLLPHNTSNQLNDENLLKHYIKAKLIEKKKVSTHQSIAITLFGKQQRINVISISSEQHENQNEEEVTQQNLNKRVQNYLVNLNTEIAFAFSGVQIKQPQLKVNYQFYGDFTEYDHLKKLVYQNFKRREELEKVKLGCIKGIIIGGQTGTGKSTLISRLKQELQNKEIKNDQKIKFHQISSTHLLSRVVGGAEEYVRKIFKQLSSKYSVLVIEDMHLLFGEKQGSHETTLATLFSEMDSFPNALIVICTYNSEKQLNPAIYQSGRFEEQISLNLPNHHNRLSIIKAMLENMQVSKDLFPQEDMKQFNLRLNGFSIGEIKHILRDAYLIHGYNFNKDTLLDILKKYRPSEIKQLIVEVPEVFWSNIGGYESVKKQIKKVTQLPLKFPEKFLKLGIQPSKGILLYGPPGCSKTMMAKAIATESKLNFIGIKGPELFSKYVGQSERAIRNLFRRARAFSPCIIFFDEIDALATQRTNEHNDVTNRLLGQLLTEMDGVQGLKEVIIIAATNRPEILDEALTRPGRFDHLIYVGPPDFQARKQIFQICLQKTPLKSALNQICDEMGSKTENYTGAQINLVCREAALLALEQNIQDPIVSEDNLNQALIKVRSRLTRASIERYEKFKGKFTQENQKQSVANIFGGFGKPKDINNFFRQ